MTVQDVVKKVIRTSGLTQREIAQRNGKSGESTISMLLKSKSMRVDSLLMILNECGYELVARSTTGLFPEYVIGNETTYEEREQVMEQKSRTRELVRELVKEELAKREAGTRSDLEDEA